MHLIKQLDKHLLNLAWSLWTELGVAGTLRNHKNVLILVEELILFTSVICESDPRLRDESIDWCAKFHHFVSMSRLKSLIGDFDKKAFSKFAATLNVNWPIFTKESSWKVKLSHKSILRPHESAALLNIRARSIFGTGARADLITFFLVHPNSDFSVAETTEMGYSKRNLAEVLDDLHFGKLFSRFNQGNQLRYRLNRDSPLYKMLQPIPEYPRPWRHVFKVFLSLRSCIHRIEGFSESSKVIELQNCLKDLEPSLEKLELSPPPFKNNFSLYLEAFSHWLLKWTGLLAEGTLC